MAPSALALTVAGTVLRGAGPNATFITIGSSFSAAEAISVAAASCSVRDLAIVGASSTVTSNPACNGIELNGYAHCRFENIWGQYVNGWLIESVGGSSQANLDTMIGRIVSRNCAGGVHVKGVTGSSFQAEHFLTDIQIQQCGAASGANANLDGLLIEDCSDVLVQGVNIGIASGHHRQRPAHQGRLRHRRGHQPRCRRQRNLGQRRGAAHRVQR